MTHRTFALIQEHPRAYTFLAATVFVMFKFYRLCLLQVSWLPPTYHWQVLCHSQWQQSTLAEDAPVWEPMCASIWPNDARLGEGANGWHLQWVEGNECLLWCYQRDGLAVHPNYRQSHSSHTVSPSCQNILPNFQAFFRVTISAKGQKVCEVINISFVARPFPSSVRIGHCVKSS